MDTLDTGTLFIRSKKLEECAEHESRLSVRLMLNGKQFYRAGGQPFVIHPENYLIINRGQTYQTAFEDNHELEMILVAFQPQWTDNVLYDLITPEDKLLDNPFNSIRQAVWFFEKTYPMDPVIFQLFKRLRTLLDCEWSIRKEADVESIYDRLLVRMLDVHRNIRKDVDRLKEVKLSTRVELYRRLHRAKDYLDAHVSSKVSVQEVSLVACLSAHHFKRTFRSAFGISPHQYHVSRRMDVARTLLQKGLAVQEVCASTGFEDPSSFTRLFRKTYGCTPGRYPELKANEN